MDLESLNSSYAEYLKKLKTIKELDSLAYGFYEIKKLPILGVVFSTYEYQNKVTAGIFNLESKTGSIETGFKDGNYDNLIDRSKVEIVDGKINLQGKPVIFEAK